MKPKNECKIYYDGPRIASADGKIFRKFSCRRCHAAISIDCTSITSVQAFTEAQRKCPLQQESK